MPQPRQIGDVLAQLIARRGYARQQSTAAWESAWRAVVGQKLSTLSRAGSVRRGTLEVTVANNLLAQELGFQKEDFIKRLNASSPDEPITGIRFRVGSVN
jgi:predicted nucleic acid-binding Zn ribbon protein